MTTAALASSTGNLAFDISRLWAKFMLAVTGVRTEIRGRDNIEAGRSHVIIANFSPFSLEARPS
jgi:hypothetical protein